MNKRAAQRQELSPLFESLVNDDRTDALFGYLTSHSSLPGQRANLELAQAFADTITLWAPQERQRMWALCVQLTSISPEEAPANDPREFLPFCGTVGLGAVGATTLDCLAPALQALCDLSGDPRWRMREAVCFGLQRLLAADTQATVAALESWLADTSWLKLRAVAAAVAEPTLLQDADLADTALDLHKKILERVQEAGDSDRRTEPFKTLRKGLGYTLSVIVQAIPGEGFAWLNRLAGSRDQDVLWIVRQNLNKNRLVRRFPDQVERLKCVIRGE